MWEARFSECPESKELASKPVIPLPAEVSFVSLIVPSCPRRRTFAPCTPDLESVLFTDQEIKKRVKGLGKELKKAYGSGEFTIISIINGAVMFTADLMREIDNPVRLDCIRISSYGDKTQSVATPQVVHSLTLDIAKRHVLLIDDILDTGKTLALVSNLIRKLNPASLRVCVLLDKKGRREVPFGGRLRRIQYPRQVCRRLWPRFRRALPQPPLHRRAQARTPEPAGVGLRGPFFIFARTTVVRPAVQT